MKSDQKITAPGETNLSLDTTHNSFKKKDFDV